MNVLQQYENIRKKVIGYVCLLETGLETEDSIGRVAQAENFDSLLLKAELSYYQNSRPKI